MTQHWIFREPALAFGLPVYVFAAIIFPLHLGWIGTSWLEFGGYLVIAAVLFAIVDALLQPSYYPKWLSVLPQAFFSLLALALPAALLFAIGSAVGGVDESFDEVVCASRGATEIDTVEAESDDSFDFTPDCTDAQ
jgi:hypothetical protein